MDGAHHVETIEGVRRQGLDWSVPSVRLAGAPDGAPAGALPVLHGTSSLVTGGDVDVPLLIREFYEACHLPPPLVLRAQDAADMEPVFDFCDTNMGTAGYVASSTALLAPAEMLHHSFDGPVPLMILVAMTAIVMAHAGYRRIQRGVRRDRVVAFDDDAARERFVQRGAGTTPEAILACLTSAIASTGHQATWEAPDHEIERTHGCLRLGADLVVADKGDARILGIERHVASCLVDGTGDAASMPVTLARACALAAAVDEVVLLDGVALFLPGGMRPRKAGHGAALSLLDMSDEERAQCREIMDGSGCADVPALIRAASRWPDPDRRALLFGVVGMDDAMETLGERPCATDGFGALYRTGEGFPKLCMVRARAGLVSPSGRAVERWTRVRDHHVTPGEGLAWALGTTLGAWTDTLESRATPVESRS